MTHQGALKISYVETEQALFDIALKITLVTRTLNMMLQHGTLRLVRKRSEHLLRFQAPTSTVKGKFLVISANFFNFLC